MYQSVCTVQTLAIAIIQEAKRGHANTGNIRVALSITIGPSWEAMKIVWRKNSSRLNCAITKVISAGAIFSQLARLIAAVNIVVVFIGASVIFVGPLSIINLTDTLSAAARLAA